MTTQPSLFVSHGAPSLVISQDPARRFLEQLMPRLARPRAIVVVSAHWQTRTPAVTAARTPETIHDFRGFPAELYALRYPAHTDSAVIDRIEALLATANLPLIRTVERGYDHGAWMPLLLALPRADIPVIQLSLPVDPDPRTSFAYGQTLAPLRQENVLLIGSGAITHNLRRLSPPGCPLADWAVRFDADIANAIAARALENLMSVFETWTDAELAHPEPDHLLPLYVAMGAAWEAGHSALIHRSFTYGSLSMASYAFGEADLPLIRSDAKAA